MNSPFAGNAVRRPIGAAVLLAVLALLVPPHSVGEAVAKEVTRKSCDNKFRACIDRCAANNHNKDGGTANCAKRTCAPQHDFCLASIGEKTGGGKGGRLVVPPKLSIGSRGPYSSTISGGLLDGSPVLSSQRPAAAGIPIAPRAPAGRPVIIR
jgi:hypothetical protein